MSYGILSAGAQMKSDGMKGLADADRMRQQREMRNDQMKQAAKQSKMSGAASGAAMGATFGPWGAVIGGVAGYILS